MSALRDALYGLPETVFADVLERDDAYLLVVDVPGASAETVDANAERGRIRIEAHRRKRTPEGFRYVSENRPLFLDAVLPLPPDADASGAEATVDRGVVELHIPKRTTADGTTIPVEDG